MRSRLLVILLLILLLIPLLASPALAQRPAPLDDDLGEAEACDPDGAAALRQGDPLQARDLFEGARLRAALADPCRSAACGYFVARTDHLRGDLRAAEQAYLRYLAALGLEQQGRCDAARDLGRRLHHQALRRLGEVRAQRERPRRRWIAAVISAASTVVVIGVTLAVALPLREQHIYYP